METKQKTKVVRYLDGECIRIIAYFLNDRFNLKASHIRRLLEGERIKYRGFYYQLCYSRHQVFLNRSPVSFVLFILWANYDIKKIQYTQNEMIERFLKGYKDKIIIVNAGRYKYKYKLTGLQKQIVYNYVSLFIIFFILFSGVSYMVISLMPFSIYSICVILNIILANCMAVIYTREKYKGE